MKNGIGNEPRLKRAAWLAAGVFLLFVLLWSRLTVFFEPDFHQTRQIHGALNARTIYCTWFDGEECTPELNATLRLSVLEPPVLEILSALAYVAAGGEALWVPRLISALFWLAGALLLFRLIRDWYSPFPALIGVAFYLFHPYVLAASTSIQPDPMMICIVIAGYVGFHRTRSALSPYVLIPLALAVFIKPYGLLYLLPVIVTDRRVYSLRGAALLGLAMLPAAVYYIPGIFSGAHLKGQAQGSFVPSLLLSGEFYRTWAELISRSFGRLMQLFLLVSLFVTVNKEARKNSVAMIAGYLLSGFLFTYHIHTHDYYSLFLVVPASLGAAGVAAYLLHHRDTPFRIITVTLFTLAILVFSLRNLPTVDELALRSREDRAMKERYRELADYIRPLEHVVALCPAYNLPLTYYGKVSRPPCWPTEWDLKAARLRGQVPPDARARFEGNRWRYFVLCREMLSSVHAQPDLNEILLSRRYIRNSAMDVVVDMERLDTAPQMEPTDLSHPLP